MRREAGMMDPGVADTVGAYAIATEGTAWELGLADMDMSGAVTPGIGKTVSMVQQAGS